MPHIYTIYMKTYVYKKLIYLFPGIFSLWRIHYAYLICPDQSANIIFLYEQCKKQV